MAQQANPTLGTPRVERPVAHQHLPITPVVERPKTPRPEHTIPRPKPTALVSRYGHPFGEDHKELRRKDELKSGLSPH